MIKKLSKKLINEHHGNQNDVQNYSLWKLYVMHMKLIAKMAPVQFTIYIILGISTYLFYPFAISFSAKFINSVVSFYQKPEFIMIFGKEIALPVYYAFLWFGIWIIQRIIKIVRDLSEALFWIVVYHGGVYRLILDRFYSLNLQEIQDNKIFEALARFGQYWFSNAKNIHKYTVSLIGAVVSLSLTFYVMFQEHSTYGLLFYAGITALLPFLSSVVLYIQDKLYRNFVKTETNKFRMRDYLLTILFDSKTFLERKVNKLYFNLVKRYSELEDKIVKDKFANWSKHEMLVGVFNTFEYYLFVLLRVLFVGKSIVSKVPVGTITGNLTFLDNIYKKVKSLLNNTTNIMASLRYTVDLFQILDYKGFADIKIDDNLKGTKDVNGKFNYAKNLKIEFKNLNFKFSDSKQYILKDTNVRFESGQSVFIYGRDGSGKSALVKILTASFKIPENSYFINNIPIEKVPRGYVKNMFALAPEYFDRYFFSLKENVTLGTGKFNKSLYIKALKIADIYEFFKKKNLLFSNKPLGKYFGDGMALPSGFWQRIAIARAIYLNRQVLLCDMCFTYIDQHARSKILENLLKYTKAQNMLFIFITEDFDFVSHFDVVYMKTKTHLRKLTTKQIKELNVRLET